MTAFVNRFGVVGKRNVYKDAEVKEIEMEVTTPDCTMIGEDFNIQVLVRSKVDQKRQIRMKATLNSESYTGVCDKRIRIDTFEIELKAKESKSMML